MILNIIDRRTNLYRWRSVTAIVEPTHHDNSIAGADQADDDPTSTIYAQRADISVADAISWAHSLPYGATLYLYDLGKGINIVRLNETEHCAHAAVRMHDT